MYKILPLSKKVQKQIRELRPSEKRRLRQAFINIETNPYWAPGNKIERLKGDLAYLGWHYELSHGYRIHYKIFEETKEIKITFVGPHPDY